MHFQGHPEYGELTLFKEYRRDVKRFLRGERETYPSVPRAYFGTEAMQFTENFRKLAVARRSERVFEKFPEVELIAALKNTWRASSVRIYRNWLEILLDNKSSSQPATVMSRVGRG